MCEEGISANQSIGLAALSALFAASLAANGQGLAFTYYSSRHYFRNAEFLSLGKDATNVELSTAISAERYHSKATLALNEVIHEILKTVE